jgi:hypothetical protein
LGRRCGGHMPRDDSKIVKAAKAWALARAALHEIADQGEAELAIHGVAERAQAFKEAEDALCQAIKRATLQRHTLDARDALAGMKRSSPSTMLIVSPSAESGRNSPS